MIDERKYIVICKYPFGTKKFVKQVNKKSTTYNELMLTDEEHGCVIVGYDIAERIRKNMIKGIKDVHGQGYRPRFFLVRADKLFVPS